MFPGVALLTDRKDFASQWEQALTSHGLQANVCDTGDLASAVQSHGAVVVDAASQQDDEDELLATIGFIAAHGVMPVVHLPVANTEVDDVVDELCSGLVTRTRKDVARVAQGMPRRLDQARAGRFEFVTVSPTGDGVLAVMGCGNAKLLPRPLGQSDDLTSIVAIELAKDASAATIEFQSGAVHTVRASSLTGSNGQARALGTDGIDLEGGRLGARLRELRLAAGLTQAELARRTGIHRPNIARVEAGRHTPSLETLSRIATAIGVPATRVLSSER